MEATGLKFQFLFPVSDNPSAGFGEIAYQPFLKRFFTGDRESISKTLAPLITLL